MNNPDYSSDVHYNINIPYDTSYNGNPSPCIYNEERTQPILNTPSDYEMVVTYANAPGKSIPIFICPVIYDPITPANINLTPFTISWDLVSTTNYANIANGLVGLASATGQVIYFSQSQYSGYSLPNPPTVANVQDLSTPSSVLYYSIYSYAWFINMLNIALGGAWQAFYLNLTPTQQGNLPVGVTAVLPPGQFYYDGETEKIAYKYLITWTLQFADPTVLFTPLLTVNSQLSSYLPKLCKLDITSVPFVAQSPQIYSALYPVEVLAIDSTNTYFIQYQEVTDLIDLTSFVGIVVTCDGMPTYQEGIPGNKLTQLNTNSQPLQGLSNLRQILINYEPNYYNQSNGIPSSIQYFPAGEYKITGFNSNVPLARLTFQFWWMDKYNNMYPLQLTPNTSAILRVTFRKKTSKRVK